MGYTHYWLQTRDLTKTEWKDVARCVKAIVTCAESQHGIVLSGYAPEDDDQGPIFDENHIVFNGTGDGWYETFEVERARATLTESEKKYGKTRGATFCKTERKTYDVVVTAVLCYLATVTNTHFVTSDGEGKDFVAGLALAKEALPEYSNVLDIPRPVMRADLWDYLSLNIKCKTIEIRQCIDGFGYVGLYAGREVKWARFPSHENLRQWMKATQAVKFRNYEFESNIWDSTGFFHGERIQKLARAQRSAVRNLFARIEQDFMPGVIMAPPPAFVRPDGTLVFENSNVFPLRRKERQNGRLRIWPA